MLVSRNSQNKILELLEIFPAVAVLGVRQCGKTELSKQIGAGWRYIDLESANDYDLVSRDPRFFFAQNPERIIIDEAQTYPVLFNELRGIIDAQRSRKGRFIITGSSSPDLIQSISETLAGRIGVVELGTLKINEFAQKPLSDFYKLFAQKLDKTFISTIKPQFSSAEVLRFWFSGGYPEPVLAKDEKVWNAWMQSYFDMYINRDIQSLFPKLDKIRFRRFVQMLAHMSGAPLLRNDIAQSVEVSESTIKDYIEIAAGTYIWRNLTSFEHQVKKQVFKMPRGHFRDSGLLHFLLKIRSPEDLENHPLLGRSFESFVIEEILKGLESTLVTGWSAHYYRTRARSEIDLILHGPFGVLPIEIKYGSRVSLKDFSTVRSFVREHALPFGILINNATNVEWLCPEVIQLPVGCL